MKAGSAIPSAFASVVGAVSRFGPIVPVALAGWKVWQVAQPLEVKTAFPAAAFPPPPDGVVFPPAVVVASAVVVSAAVVPPEGDATVTVCTTVEDELPISV